MTGKPTILQRGAKTVRLTIEFEREGETRWIAEVMELPGVMVYGSSRAEASTRVKALALNRVADMLAHGEFEIEKVIEFDEGDEIGSPMLARIAKRTGLKPSDLRSAHTLSLRRPQTDSASATFQDSALEVASAMPRPPDTWNNLSRSGGHTRSTPACSQTADQIVSPGARSIRSAARTA